MLEKISINDYENHSLHREVEVEAASGELQETLNTAGEYFMFLRRPVVQRIAK